MALGYEGLQQTWDPTAVAFLRRTLARYRNLRIVVSSAWRINHTARSFADLLGVIGIPPQSMFDHAEDWKTRQRNMKGED
jgi:hypothetical protein